MKKNIVNKESYNSLINIRWVLDLGNEVIKVGFNLMDKDKIYIKTVFKMGSVKDSLYNEYIQKN